MIFLQIIKFLRNTKIRNFILYVSLILNLCIGIILWCPLTEQLYKPLIINEPLRKSEVIVILSAGIYDSGLPDFRTLVRLRRGLIIYRYNWADKIICAGGDRLKGIKISSAEAMKESLTFEGVPQGDIFTQDETQHTYNDIVYLLNKFKTKFDFNNAIFVTSSYHTYRVKKILEKMNINAIVVSAEPYELYPIFWTERLGLFKEVIREYLVIFYSKTKGSI